MKIATKEIIRQLRNSLKCSVRTCCSNFSLPFAELIKTIYSDKGFRVKKKVA